MYYVPLLYDSKQTSQAGNESFPPNTARMCPYHSWSDPWVADPQEFFCPPKHVAPQVSEFMPSMKSFRR